jgi:S1-C subfamily serine protease
VARVLVALVLSAVLINYVSPITATPEKILDKVVRVNGASGVIIHSNDKHTLVLTNYHVVENQMSDDGKLVDDKRPRVTFHYTYRNEDKTFSGTNIHYECKEIYFDKKIDLAVLRIDIGTELEYAKLITRGVELGEDIYVAANPNNNYRTIVKGIISNKDDRYANDSPLLQISGGVTYGASGGGAFAMDGELVALARSVDLHYTSFCTTKRFGDIEFHDCFTGFFAVYRV